MMWIKTFALSVKAEAIISGDAASVASTAGESDPAICFARGLWLADHGSPGEAAEAFAKAAADPALALAADVERAFAELALGGAAASALAAAQRALEDPNSGALLKARAHQLKGKVAIEGVDVAAALDPLMAARAIYSAEKCQLGLAQTLDMMGTVYRWLGRTELSGLAYASSIAAKAVIGDRGGIAISIGQLSGLARELGHVDLAADLARTQLASAQERADMRGQVRALINLGMALADAKTRGEARTAFADALALALTGKIERQAFLALKELCLLELADGRPDAARARLDEAAILAAKLGDYEQRLAEFLKALIGEDGHALVAVADKFRNADLPELEIEARLAATAALGKAGDAHAGVQALLAWKRALAKGMDFFKTRIQERLAMLDLRARIDEESGRAFNEAATFDGYQLRGQIGRGAYGEVHRAFDFQRGREVAVKRIQVDQVYDRTRRDALIDSARLELEAAARVSFRGLVETLALGRDDRGNPYLVQEFIPGQTFRHYVAKKKEIPLARRAHYLTQVARALDVLHSAKVIHRDLKPENVMMRPDLTPVIIDFGISVLLGDDAGKHLVAEGGSPFYEAPENPSGRFSYAADVYALGVMAWEWLAGVNLAVEGTEPPWEQSQPIFPFIFGHRSEHDRLSALLHAKLGRLIAHNPSCRAADGGAAAAVLVELCEELKSWSPA